MKVYLAKNYQNFKIYFTFLLFWFGIQFGDIVEDSIAFVLVLTVGLLHGANDLLILSLKKKNSKKMLKNLIIYLLIIFSCVALFFINSYIALLLFVIVSSYHFGEEHLSYKIFMNHFYNSLYFLVYGLIIFSMIFYNSLEEVNRIMLELANIPFTKNQIEVSFIISLIIFLVMSSVLVIKNNLNFKILAEEVFYLLFLFLVFKTTSLILGFAIYFIFWHSFPSIIHQINFISEKVDNKSIIYYIKKAVPFWLISIAGLVVLYFILPDIKLFSTIVFVILFAITVPHIWVMYKMKN